MIGVKEVAERLCVSRNTVRRLIRDGSLIGMKVGKLFKVKQESLELYVKT